MSRIYDTDLDKNRANYTPLSPLSFLRRARDVYPDHPAVVYGERGYSWNETYTRCTRLADALARRGVDRATRSPSWPPTFPRCSKLISPSPWRARC